MGTTPCPRCATPSLELVPLDAAIRLVLTNAGTAGLPSLVCAKCYAELSGAVSQGLKLRIEKEAREKNKLMLWKSRVNLIRQARGLMAQKAFSEAAVAYEKYLRVLEMVYNKKAGDLSPEVFNNSKRSKELTVVTSVYWDLMRIYDTSPRYGNRMNQASAKLVQFLPFSPIYPDVIKKAEAFIRQAKNPKVVQNFLKNSKSGKGRCFIATVVLSPSDQPELAALRDFRDQYLIPSTPGRKFVHWYYRNSPAMAEWISRHPWAKNALRPPLRLIAQAAKKSLK